jgi:sialate O-acetylesterase
MKKPRSGTLIVPRLLFGVVCCASGMMLLGALPLRAELATPAVFGTHMVLQQGRRVPVWGTASEGERVTVSFGGQKVEAVAKNERWMAWLEPMKASSTPQSMTISGSNTLTFTDVLVGEAWICGGQSNMERKLPQLVSRPPAAPSNWEQEAARAKYPEIRHLTVPQASSTNPLATASTPKGRC